MRKWLLVAAFAALSATACGRNHTPHIRTRVPAKEFIAVMVELGNSQPHQRQIILQRHHVTDQDLRDFVAAYSRYPQAFSAVLDSIQTHLGPHGPTPL